MIKIAGIVMSVVIGMGAATATFADLGDVTTTIDAGVTSTFVETQEWVPNTYTAADGTTSYTQVSEGSDSYSNGSGGFSLKTDLDALTGLTFNAGSDSVQTQITGDVTLSGTVVTFANGATLDLSDFVTVSDLGSAGTIVSGVRTGQTGILGSIYDAIDGNSSSISGLTNTVGALNTIAGNNTTAINNVKGDVTTIKSQISTLNGSGAGSVAKAQADAEAYADNNDTSVSSVSVNASGILTFVMANGTNFTADVSSLLDNTDTQLTDAQIAALGYIKTDTNTQLSKSDIETLGFVSGAHTVDTNTQLSKSDIETLGFVSGAHTVDTNTQLTAVQVNSAIVLATIEALGFSTTDNNSQLTAAQVNSAIVVATIEALGFSTTDNNTQLTGAQVNAAIVVATIEALGFSTTDNDTQLTAAQVNAAITKVTLTTLLSGEYDSAGSAAAALVSAKAYADNNDTVLTESQVDTFVSNNNFADVTQVATDIAAEATRVDGIVGSAAATSFVAASGNFLGSTITLNADGVTWNVDGLGTFTNAQLLSEGISQSELDAIAASGLIGDIAGNSAAISAVIIDLAQEVTDRIAADNALSGRIDSLEDTALTVSLSSAGILTVTGVNGISASQDLTSIDTNTFASFDSSTNVISFVGGSSIDLDTIAGSVGTVDASGVRTGQSGALGSLQDQIDALSGSTTAADASNTNAQAITDLTNGAVKDNTDAISGLDTRLGTAEGNISTNAGNISTNAGNISANASAIAQEILDRAAADAVLLGSPVAAIAEVRGRVVFSTTTYVETYFGSEWYRPNGATYGGYSLSTILGWGGGVYTPGSAAVDAIAATGISGNAEAITKEILDRADAITALSGQAAHSFTYSSITGRVTVLAADGVTSLGSFQAGHTFESLNNGSDALNGVGNSAAGFATDAELAAAIDALENDISNASSTQSTLDTAQRTDIDVNTAAIGSAGTPAVLGVFTSSANVVYTQDATDGKFYTPGNNFGYSQSVVQSWINGGDGSWTVEAVAAVDADGLRGDIADETTARIAADAVLQADIDANEATATADRAAIRSEFASADSALQADIDANESSSDAADVTLQSNIDSEAIAREAADDALQSSLDSAVDALELALAAEKTARLAAATAENLARVAAELVLTNDLASEVNRAMAVETLLQADIDANEAASIAADNVLTADIDNIGRSFDNDGVDAAIASAASIAAASVASGEAADIVSSYVDNGTAFDSVAASLVQEAVARIQADAIHDIKLAIHEGRLNDIDVILADHESRISYLEALHVVDKSFSKVIDGPNGTKIVMHFDADGTMRGKARTLTFLENPVVHGEMDILWNDQGKAVNAITGKLVDANTGLPMADKVEAEVKLDVAKPAAELSMDVRFGTQEAKEVLVAKVDAPVITQSEMNAEIAKFQSMFNMPIVESVAVEMPVAKAAVVEMVAEEVVVIDEAKSLAASVADLFSGMFSSKTEVKAEVKVTEKSPMNVGNPFGK